MNREACTIMARIGKVWYLRSRRERTKTLLIRQSIPSQRQQKKRGKLSSVSPQRPRIPLLIATSPLDTRPTLYMKFTSLLALFYGEASACGVRRFRYQGRVFLIKGGISSPGGLFSFLSNIFLSNETLPRQMASYLAFSLSSDCSFSQMRLFFLSDEIFSEW